jgi:hypothetical protein
MRFIQKSALVSTEEYNIKSFASLDKQHAGFSRVARAFPHPPLRMPFSLGVVTSM